MSSARQRWAALLVLAAVSSAGHFSAALGIGTAQRWAALGLWQRWAALRHGQRWAALPSAAQRYWYWQRWQRCLALGRLDSAGQRWAALPVLVALGSAGQRWPSAAQLWAALGSGLPLFALPSGKKGPKQRCFKIAIAATSAAQRCPALGSAAGQRWAALGSAAQRCPALFQVCR